MVIEAINAVVVVTIPTEVAVLPVMMRTVGVVEAAPDRKKLLNAKKIEMIDEVIIIEIDIVIAVAVAIEIVVIAMVIIKLLIMRIFFIFCLFDRYLKN